MSSTPHFFALCLLLPHVIAEWVEIEQSHHKPLRKVNINKAFAGIRNGDFEETTKENRIYRNYSTDKQWSKGIVDRVTNVGNIRRVHDPSVKTVGIKVIPEPGVFKNDVKNNDRSNYHVSAVTPQRYNIFDKSYKTKIKPSPGNLSDKEDNTNYNNINTGTKHTIEDFENIETVPNDSHRKIAHDEDKINISSRKRINQAGILRKEPFKHEDREILNNFNDDHTNFQRINIGDRWTSKRPILFSTTQTSLIKNTQTTHSTDIEDKDKEDVTRDTIFPNISLKGPVRISILDKSKIYKTHNQPALFKTKTDVPVEKTEMVEESHRDEELRISDSEEISNSSKADAVSGMWRLMKVVTDTIYKNTHRSFRSKVKYLERLRTTILTTIEDQIETIWWDDDTAERRSHSRRAREARGHLEFPSSEGALMSISFLTFAVFLIKLVLQVLHTYKNKTMMVAPTVVTAVGRAAHVLRSRL